MAGYQRLCLKRTSKLFPCRRQTTQTFPVMDCGVRLTTMSATGMFDSWKLDEILWAVNDNAALKCISNREGIMDIYYSQGESFLHISGASIAKKTGKWHTAVATAEIQHHTLILYLLCRIVCTYIYNVFFQVWCSKRCPSCMGLRRH